MKTMFLCLAAAASMASTVLASSYSVGTGKSDSTPGFVDLKTMGYGAPIPTTSGLHTRLNVRAVTIRSTSDAAVALPETKELHLALVDTCFITQKLKIEAVEQLQRKFGAKYTLANTVIAATHTHNAPGGTSSYGHYEISSGGFIPEVYQAQLTAIVEAFTQAEASLAPADLAFATGVLEGASRNRSLAAHQQNPAPERALFPAHVSTETLALFAKGEDGLEKLALHLFPVHATTSDRSTLLIQSDNKGLAAVLDERETKSRRAPGAVTMFFNGGAGDSSPNVLGDVDGNGDWDCAANDTACTLWSANQHLKSLNELRRPDVLRRLEGPLASVHAYFDLDDVVTPNGSTCPGAFGLSMLAGSLEDGPGTPLTTEGVSCSNPSPLARTRCVLRRFECHGEKPVMLATGYRGDVRTPHHLPFQVLRIGQLALVTVPSEVTTIATWRIRNAVKAVLEPLGIEEVQLFGYANAYSAYVTTPEEYDLQHYEGASTLFGRNTLDAYIKILTTLAGDLRADRNATRGVSVASFRELLTPGKTTSLPMATSVLRRGERYGDLSQGVAESYRPGARLTFSYLSPNPNLFPLRGSSYVDIQVQEGDGWKSVFTDSDPEITVEWAKQPSSTMTVTWQIPADLAVGKYRIVYRVLPSPTARTVVEKVLSTTIFR